MPCPVATSVLAPGDHTPLQGKPTRPLGLPIRPNAYVPCPFSGGARPFCQLNAPAALNGNQGESATLGGPGGRA